MTRFGERLREVRQRVGISQERLADLALLHRTYVSSVERGRNNISLVNIERLAVALGVPMRDLMPDPEEREAQATPRKPRTRPSAQAGSPSARRTSGASPAKR